jgi:hypothetical protein
MKREGEGEEVDTVGVEFFSIESDTWQFLKGRNFGSGAPRQDMGLSAHQ